MGSTNEKTSIIAAETRRELRDLYGFNPIPDNEGSEDLAIIKSALDKAYFKGQNDAFGSPEWKSRAAHASEQGADTELVREIAQESAVESRLRKYVVVQITTSTWDKLQERFAALSQRPTPATASEPVQRAMEQGTAQGWEKPDSASVGEHVNPVVMVIERKRTIPTHHNTCPKGERCMCYITGYTDAEYDHGHVYESLDDKLTISEKKAIAATPSGGGEWTHEKLQGLLGISHEDRYVTDQNFENTLDEINQSLQPRDCGEEGRQLASAIDLANSWAREIGVDECNDNSLRDLIDRIWSKASGLIYSKRDCGEDTKRLDWGILHPYDFHHINLAHPEETGDQAKVRVRSDIDAAMKEQT